MKKSLLLVPFSWLLTTAICSASESLLWVGYNQNTTDFFKDASSQIKPTGVILGMSTEISENWGVTLSYGDFEGDTSATVFENNQVTLVNSGKTSSTSSGVSFNWFEDDYGLTFSYAQIDNKENSLTRLPLVEEEIIGDDQVFSASYDSFIDVDNWSFGWSLGTQFAKSSVTVEDVVGTTPPIMIDAKFDSDSVSFFIDLDFSFPIKKESYSMTPKFTLSWTSEISNSGDEVVTITRGDERKIFNQLSDRLGTTFRTPDSGFWETALDIEWDNGWGATLAYGQSIAADINVDSLSFDVSVAF
jgi:hypothetical protein